MRNLTFFLMTYTLISGVKLSAQPGTLDSTFSDDGKVKTRNFGYADVSSVALQKDEKIVVGCTFGHYADYVGLIRYKKNGSIDENFGINGAAQTKLDAYTAAMAIQPDGKIVLTGSVYSFGDSKIVLVRYKSNGTLDSSFGADGKVKTNFHQHEVAFSLALQADGKILVAGRLYTGSQNIFAVFRFEKNGGLDSSFGTFGKATALVGKNEDYAYSVAVQDDGKIVVAGDSFDNTGSVSDIAVVRFKETGSIDSSFGKNGKVVSDFGDDYSRSLVIQNDGKILVGGTVNGRVALLRYKYSGVPDSSFGVDGSAFIHKGWCRAIALHDNGKILIACNVDSYDFSVFRCKSNGELDEAFGKNGRVNIDFGTDKTETPTCLAIQPDDKIAVAGESTHKVAIARLNGKNSFYLYSEKTHSSVNRTKEKVQCNAQSKISGSEKNQLIPYPNPATNATTIKFTGTKGSKYTIDVTDLAGKVLQRINGISSSGENKITLDVSKYASGMYLINLIDENGKRSVKLSKQ